MHRLAYFKTVVFILVFAFTFVLRAHSYERVPTPNHLDEQLYALSGINLVEVGTPISWSTLEYPKSAEVYKGIISYKGGDPSASVTLYKPWLDEPPLFSLLVGYSAHLFGADRNGFIPSTYIRFPIIFISALTSILVFLIAYEIKGYWIGILSMLIYGTEPIMVFASRSAMPETVITFFYCLTVYLLIKFRKKTRFWYILPIPILAGLAGLSKPTGYFIVFLAIYLVVEVLYKTKPIPWKRIIKYASYLLLATIPFVALYIWYGNHFSPEIFKRIISIQGFRPAGFNSLAWFLMTPSFDTSILRSSWYMFCLITAMFFVFKKKDEETKIISMGFVYWVIIVMLSSGENDLLAWYRFPALPFLAIFGALAIKYLYKKADFFSSFVVVGMLLGSRMLLVNAFRPNIDSSSFRYIFTALLVPSLINTILKKEWLKKISKMIIAIVVIVGMWWNIKYVYNAYDLACESKTCPMVPTTFLSDLHYPFFWRFISLGEAKLH